MTEETPVYPKPGHNEEQRPVPREDKCLELAAKVRSMFGDGDYAQLVFKAAVQATSIGEFRW